MSGKTPEDYRSPFDRPVKARPAGTRPVWKLPVIRIAYWFVCLLLIASLLWYIRTTLVAATE
jgi:hypothetical protein